MGKQMDRPPTELDHFRSMLQSYMLKKGLRSTDQRKLIVETFFRADNHVSIEELLAHVRAQDPRVGYATVYRTLKLLTECGVCLLYTSLRVHQAEEGVQRRAPFALNEVPVTLA